MNQLGSIFWIKFPKWNLFYEPKSTTFGISKHDTDCDSVVIFFISPHLPTEYSHPPLSTCFILSRVSSSLLPVWTQWSPRYESGGKSIVFASSVRLFYPIARLSLSRLVKGELRHRGESWCIADWIIYRGSAIESVVGKHSLIPQ